MRTPHFTERFSTYLALAIAGLVLAAGVDLMAPPPREDLSLCGAGAVRPDVAQGAARRLTGGDPVHAGMPRFLASLDCP